MQHTLQRVLLWHSVGACGPCQFIHWRLQVTHSHPCQLRVSLGQHDLHLVCKRGQGGNRGAGETRDGRRNQPWTAYVSLTLLQLARCSGERIAPFNCANVASAGDTNTRVGPRVVSMHTFMLATMMRVGYVNDA